MKSSILFLLILLQAAPGQLAAAVFKTAKVTRVLNDVRVVQNQSNANTARIGDVITGSTAVATGVSSRAELKFPDQTLTRLGANTLFRLEEGTRDIDLQQGVLLLQVPKQLGGARVRTAAVTAAVTGTTILVEYEPNGYIKMIVIEGEIDLFMNDKPSNYITLKAGDMIVMKPDAKEFPLPVQVDLKRLINTSKLLNPDEFGPIGNDKQITAALDQQDDLKKKGELLNTAFMLPGIGTQVTFTNEVRREIFRFQDPPRNATQNPPSNNNSTSNPGNPGKPGSTPPSSPRPFIPGTTYITDDTSIVTNPHITAYNSLVNADVTSRGSYYRSSQDGTVGSAIFGIPPVPSPLDSLVASAGLWAAFHFENLVIVGNPAVNSATGARNLLLASNLGIELLYNQFNTSEAPQAVLPPTGSGEFDLGTNLNNLMLTSKQGPITISGSFEIRGDNQNVLFQTFGSDGDISINSNAEFTNINVPNGSFNAAASRDILFSGAGIRASTVNLNAKRDITLTNGTDIAAKDKINLIANRSFTISNSSQLRTLGEQIDPLQIDIAARGGDLSVLDSDISADHVNLESTLNNIVLTNSTISADVIRARAMSPNGQLLINGTTFNASSALKLYAEGSNGQVRFTGNSSLNGPSATIAAKTVTIDSGVNVSVRNPASLRVHTDNRNFSNNLGNPSFGAFTDGTAPISVPANSFSSRPGY